MLKIYLKWWAFFHILFLVEEGRVSKSTLATIRELVAKEGPYVGFRHKYPHVKHTEERELFKR